VLQNEDSPIHLAQQEKATVTPPTDTSLQPKIVGKEEGDIEMNEFDDDDEDKELLEDEL